jgi:SAM-dependent methyltransferase
MLIDAVRRQPLAPGARVVDLCTGSGAVAVAAALRGASVTAVDVSRRALLSAQLNAMINGVRVRTRRGNLLDAVRGERFDLIVANPPYLPGVVVFASRLVLIGGQEREPWPIDCPSSGRPRSGLERQGVPRLRLVPRPLVRRSRPCGSVSSPVRRRLSPH